MPQMQAALNINVLFILGALLAVVLWWAFKNTRIGLILRVVGDSTDAARAMGINPDRVRLLATAVGGSLAAVGGAYLSLYYPGSWNEGHLLRPGPDGGGAGDFRALEPDRLLPRGAAVRRCRGARPGPAIGRRHAGLLPVLRSSLRTDARHPDCHLLAHPLAVRRAGRFR
jgi:hypothetical protein